LLTYLHDALQENLPADMMARTEEEVVTVGAGGSPTTYRPDVQVRAPWTLKEPAVAAPAPKPPSITASEPIRVLLDEDRDRWIEIRDTICSITGSTPIHRSHPRMPPGWMKSSAATICVEQGTRIHLRRNPHEAREYAPSCLCATESARSPS
jgi:hypothetical protein